MNDQLLAAERAARSATFLERLQADAMRSHDVVWLLLSGTVVIVGFLPSAI